MKSEITLAFTLVAALALPAAADTGPWVDVAPGAKIRVLTADYVTGEGKVMAGLEFQLRDGMKTYWRIPGESGIPLVAEWEPVQSIENIEFLWPMPKRAVSAGYIDYVYDQDFVLPFEIAVSPDVSADGVQLAGELLMGICGEICVPVTFAIDQQVSLDQKDVAVAFTLEAAKAAVPIADTRPDAPFDAVYFDAAQNRMVVKPSADPGENQSLIFDLPSQSLLFGVPQNGPGSSLISVLPLWDVALAEFVGTEARLTYSGQAGAFEKMVPILSFDALTR